MSTFDVDHLVAADDAVQHRFFDALLDGRDVFLRNIAADDLVLDRRCLCRARSGCTLTMTWPY